MAIEGMNPAQTRRQERQEAREERLIGNSENPSQSNKQAGGCASCGGAGCASCGG